MNVLDFVMKQRSCPDYEGVQSVTAITLTTFDGEAITFPVSKWRVHEVNDFERKLE